MRRARAIAIAADLEIFPMSRDEDAQNFNVKKVTESSVYFNTFFEFHVDSQHCRTCR